MPLIFAVPVRSGRALTAFVEMFCELSPVRFAVIEWVEKFAMICTLPSSAYTVLPLVDPPRPVVTPFNVAVPVEGTVEAGV